RAGFKSEQSDDRRSIDAFRTAPAQSVGQNRRDDRCRAIKSQAEARLARDCHDREQATAGRRPGFFVVAGGWRGAVMTMLMGDAVRVDVDLAAVIVNANVTFGQAMCDAGISGESEGGRRRKNANQIERGNDGPRLRTKS